jgi:hypothetical protein
MTRINKETAKEATKGPTKDLKMDACSFFKRDGIKRQKYRVIEENALNHFEFKNFH